MVHCLNDPDTTVQEVAKLFFTSLASRGQQLYNALPDIISRLTDPTTRLSRDNTETAEEDFKLALGYLLQYIEKDKHFDSLFEQLTRRLIKAVDQRHVLELGFCLSQIKSITAKSVKPIQTLFTDNKDEIQKILCHKVIFESYKRLLKDDFSKEPLTLLIELHDKSMQENRAKTHITKKRRKKKT